MSDSAALQERMAELEALVARLLPPPSPEAQLPQLYLRQQHVAPVLVDLALLAGSVGLPHDLRELRQLSVAVALSRGDELPGAKIPVDYESAIRRLAEARGRGLSWRVALGECGLDAPDAGDIAFRTRELRSELRGLWDGLLPVLDGLRERGNALQVSNLLSFLRKIVT